MKKQKLSKWEDKDMTKEIMNAVNTQIFGVWFLIGAALVFWMQAGFAMVEAGFTRAKNAGKHYHEKPRWTSVLVLVYLF